jgi:hypothetical protein
LLKQAAEPSRLSLKIASGSVIGVFPLLGIAKVTLHRCCGFISFESSCYSACQLSCLSDVVHSFSPFPYIGEVLTGNSLDEISKTKIFLETFGLDFLREIQGLTQYFILASLSWTLIIAPLLVILHFLKANYFPAPTLVLIKNSTAKFYLKVEI